MNRISLAFIFIFLYFIAWQQNADGISYCKPRGRKAPIKIAVIDTGFGYMGAGKDAHLCPDGHKDFSGEMPQTAKIGNISVPLDTTGHGTNVTGIIESYLKENKINYCIIVIKFYNRKAFNNVGNTVMSFKYIYEQKIPYANYSAGGTDGSPIEKEVIIKYLDGGGTLFAAAGNEHANLEKRTYYPALYDSRIIVTGALDKFGHQLYSSNYGKPVSRWEIGLHVVGYGISMSGTSQASAVSAGKVISELNKPCDIGR